MNMLDLLKKTVAIVTLASIALADVVGSLLGLLSILLASSDSEEGHGVSSLGVDFYGNIHEGPVTSFFIPELGDRD